MTQIDRRALLMAGLGLALGQTDPASSRPRIGDLFVKPSDSAKAPLTPDDIAAGAPQTLSPDTRAHAADGIVAYTAICTHTGCDVDDWEPAGRLLACQCHSSQFDPRDGAKVVDGPAPRPLPALPLKIVDGKLVVAQPFTAAIAFEKG
jgi:Rieske Fe-S protein